MSQHRSTVFFVTAVCLALAAVAAAVRVFGLERQADATIRFFLFEHRNATLAGAVALYVSAIALVLVTEYWRPIKSFLRRAPGRGRNLAF